MDTATLQLTLTLLPHPYSEERSSAFEAWGRIQLDIDAAEAASLLDWQWNLDALIEWFLESEDAIRTEPLSIGEWQTHDDESLAQAIDRFRGRDDLDDDESAFDSWYNAVQAYELTHKLWYGMRGSAIPDIIIGPNHGSGDISLRSDTDDWAHQFDMPRFWSQLREQSNRFLVNWRETQAVATDSEAITFVTARIEGLLEQLRISYERWPDELIGNAPARR